MSPLLGSAIVATCLLLQGFFSGSEMALVSANRALLQSRAEGGHPGSALALEMLEHDDALLGTCLIGTNVCLVAGVTAFGLTIGGDEVGHDWYLSLLYMPLGLLLGEAIPKQVFRHYADTLAPLLASPIRTAQRVLTPALWLVRGWSRTLSTFLSAPDEEVRREDIVQLLDGESGNIEPHELALIQRLLEMNETAVESCMTPLVDVLALPETATVADGVKMVLEAGYSRIPVYQERVDNIVGRIEHRDLLFRTSSDDPITELVRPVQFVPETKRVDELLREMRGESDPLAVVVDEYGGSVGIVTLEDLFEEMLGDIEDERDKRVPGIRRIGEHEWRVPGRTEIDELAEELDRPLPEGDYETVAGLILKVAGRIPEAGEVFRIGRMAFHIEASSERAIQIVRVVLLPEAPRR
ncbi:MAG: hemolysin family protein [Myxococcota bacterium]